MEFRLYSIQLHCSLTDYSNKKFFFSNLNVVRKVPSHFTSIWFSISDPFKSKFTNLYHTLIIIIKCVLFLFFSCFLRDCNNESVDFKYIWYTHPLMKRHVVNYKFRWGSNYKLHLKEQIIILKKDFVALKSFRFYF